MVDLVLHGTFYYTVYCIVFYRKETRSYDVLRYKCIVKYKTAFYSFYIPVAMAMQLVSYHFNHMLTTW